MHKSHNPGAGGAGALPDALADTSGGALPDASARGALPDASAGAGASARGARGARGLGAGPICLRLGERALGSDLRSPGAENRLGPGHVRGRRAALAQVRAGTSGVSAEPLPARAPPLRAPAPAARAGVECAGAWNTRASCVPLENSRAPPPQSARSPGACRPQASAGPLEHPKKRPPGPLERYHRACIRCTSSEIHEQIRRVEAGENAELCERVYLFYPATSRLIAAQ
jgi:hypothetical protein